MRLFLCTRWYDAGARVDNELLKCKWVRARNTLGDKMRVCVVCIAGVDGYAPLVAGLGLHKLGVVEYPKRTGCTFR